MLVSWAAEDPEAAAARLDIIQTRPNGWGGGDQPEEAIMAGLLKKDPDEALQWFTKNQVDPRYLRYALQTFASDDPSKALDWLGNIPDSSARKSALKDLAEYYREGFDDWLAQQTNSEYASEAQEIALSQLSNTDRKAAREVMHDLPEGPHKDRIRVNLIRELGDGFDGDGQQMKAYVEALPEALRGDALATVISDRYYPNLGPSVDAELLDFMPPGEQRQEAIRATANLYKDAPSDGITWLTELSDPQEQHRAATSFTNAWAEADSYSTSQCIAGLEAVPLRDASASQLVQQMVDVEPDSAFAWAQFIANQQERQQALSRAYQSWQKAAPDATAGALQELSASDRQHLLESSR